MEKNRAELVPLFEDGKISHRVERPWRSIEALRREMRFHDRLLSLAGLPANDKLPRILEASNTYHLPEVWRRASFSALENEFLAVVDVLISSPERQWVSSIKSFLAHHGWRADLRGRPRVHPADLTDIRRGRSIDQINLRLGQGFALKLVEKRKGGYLSDDDRIEGKLLKLGYSAAEVKAILRGRTLDSAACNYYQQTTERSVRPKSIQNSYQSYKRITQTSAG